MEMIEETVTKVTKIRKGLTHYEVVKTGRMIEVPTRPVYPESEAMSRYLHSGYGSEISFESYLSSYYKKG
jgi:hypothetical protein